MGSAAKTATQDQANFGVGALSQSAFCSEGTAAHGEEMASDVSFSCFFLFRSSFEMTKPLLALHHCGRKDVLVTGRDFIRGS